MREDYLESYVFGYSSVGHAQAGCGAVSINLRREDGGEFAAILSVEDARRLLDDLPEQVRIATPGAD